SGRRFVSQGDTGHTPRAGDLVAVFVPILTTLKIDVIEGRSVWLDGDVRLYEVRAAIRELESEDSRLRMRQHDRRADLFQQGNISRKHQLLGLYCAGDALDLRGVELVENQIARDSRSARPLRMQRGLRPEVVLLWRGEQRLLLFH